MTEQELVARAQQTMEAWNRHDVDSIVAAFSHEARQAVRVDAEALLFACPDLRFEIRRTIVVGSVVVQEWVARGTRVERAGIAVADYDGAGLICAFARYWNTAAPIPLKR